MKRKTRSILEELGEYIDMNDRHSMIESRASHIISSAINLIGLIRESYDEEIATDLERRLINSIRGRDSSKFVRGIRRAKE